MEISLQLLHVSAFFFRVVLMLYGEWQDRTFELKFTDVDYHVFTDAAAFVANGQSPYLRPTYRYSPLLAWILVPCHTLHIIWGKFVFILSDTIVGFVMQKILQLKGHQDNVTKLAVSLWLYNPITMTISSRGNAESIVSVLIVTSLFMICKRKFFLSGMLFALSVHLKIFPAVTLLSIYLFLGDEYRENKKKIKVLSLFKFGRLQLLIDKLFSKERLEFFLSAFLTFSLLTMFFYWLYGFDFLEHAYLYHVKRKDIRHNFSIYFYMLYTNSEWWLGLVCFLNQLIVTVCLSVSFYKDLFLSNFLITFCFVTFNKICTSQYFLWYLTPLPLLLPGLWKTNFYEVITIAILWGSGQGIWLASAYALEFKAESVFLCVWASSVLYFIINIAIVVWFIKRYHSDSYYSIAAKSNSDATIDKSRKRL